MNELSSNSSSNSSSGSSSDEEVYRKYPKLRHWYNKLWLSEKLKYDCGPSGIQPDKPGLYITRPIMNLSGMGIGAKKTRIDNNPEDFYCPPGYFWCEFFEGRQYSLDFEFVHDKNPYWKILRCHEGIKDDSQLWKFKKWIRRNEDVRNFRLPLFFRELSDVKRINVEFIEDRIIEVHLRENPDPDYDELIPVWEDENIETKQEGYTYIPSHDNGNGFLDSSRKGFLVRNFIRNLNKNT